MQTSVYPYYVFPSGTLPHKHKLVIAGNHELSFDPTFTHPLSNCRSPSRTMHLINEIPTLGNARESLTDAVKAKNMRDRLTNCTYLQDQELILYGIKFYGTPWYVKHVVRPKLNINPKSNLAEKWPLSINCVSDAYDWGTVNKE